MNSICCNIVYWFISIIEVIIAYKIIPDFAPFVVISVIGFGIYVAKLTVESYEQNRNN